MSETITGSVKFYIKNEGWGYIFLGEESEDVFFHATDGKVVHAATVSQDDRKKDMTPKKGDDISFEITEGREGKPKAHQWVVMKKVKKDSVAPTGPISYQLVRVVEVLKAMPPLPAKVKGKRMKPAEPEVIKKDRILVFEEGSLSDLETQCPRLHDSKLDGIVEISYRFGGKGDWRLCKEDPRTAPAAPEVETSATEQDSALV